MERLKFETEELKGSGPGLISVNNWTMAPDGSNYLYFWAPEWVILTDSTMPVSGFRSSERWQIAAVVDGSVRAVIPGCQVKAWVAAATPPERCEAALYRFGVEP